LQVVSTSLTARAMMHELHKIVDEMAEEVSARHLASDTPCP
jgi:hypothetical protein